MNRMKRKLFIFTTAVSLLGTTGCGKKPESTTASQVEKKNVEVTVAKIDTVSRTTELSGTLQPVEEANLSFEMAGRISDLKKNQGDQVGAGEVLAQIEAKDYELKVSQANAGVEQAGANLEKVYNGAREEEIAQAKTGIDKASINLQKAQDDLKRMENLYQANAISLNDYENAKNRVSLAQQDLINAQQAYSLTLQGARMEDRKSMQAIYEQNVIAKQQAEQVLAKTLLKSPINGTIIEKLSSLGELVNAGTPVYRIGNIHTLKVVLPVPDREIAQWKVGNQVTLSLYGNKREGKVMKIYPSTNQGTGTIGVEVYVDNGLQDWFPGQIVNVVRKTGGDKKGIFVPVQAVISQGEEKPYLFLAVNGKAVKRPVTIGELIDNQLEITSGVKEGEQVIVKGTERLFEGDPIQVKEGNQP